MLCLLGSDCVAQRSEVARHHHQERLEVHDSLLRLCRHTTGAHLGVHAGNAALDVVALGQNGRHHVLLLLERAHVLIVDVLALDVHRLGRTLGARVDLARADQLIAQMFEHLDARHGEDTGGVLGNHVAHRAALGDALQSVANRNDVASAKAEATLYPDVGLDTHNISIDFLFEELLKHPGLALGRALGRALSTTGTTTGATTGVTTGATSSAHRSFIRVRGIRPPSNTSSARHLEGGGLLVKAGFA